MDCPGRRQPTWKSPQSTPASCRRSSCASACSGSARWSRPGRFAARSRTDAAGRTVFEVVGARGTREPLGELGDVGAYSRGRAGKVFIQWVAEASPTPLAATAAVAWNGPRSCRPAAATSRPALRRDIHLVGGEVAGNETTVVPFPNTHSNAPSNAANPPSLVGATGSGAVISVSIAASVSGTETGTTASIAAWSSDAVGTLAGRRPTKQPAVVRCPGSNAGAQSTPPR